MMKATFTTGYTGVKDDFDANKIIVKEVPFPIPAADEVQIKVAASSVNPIDWKISCGALAQMMPLDMSVPLGFVCAGVVTAVGSSVTRMKVGQSVWADVIQRGPRGVTLGAYAEYVVTKESKASLKPTNLTVAEAGSIPLAGLTAVQCLRAIDTNEGSSAGAGWLRCHRHGRHPDRQGDGREGVHDLQHSQHRVREEPWPG